MELKSVSLNGKVIRPKGEEFTNTGILVVFSRHIAATNMISAYVKYFRLDLNPEADFAYVQDQEFHCPREYFLNNFEMLDDSGPEMKWIKML